jgi:hypothetical protein
VSGLYVRVVEWCKYYTHTPPRVLCLPQGVRAAAAEGGATYQAFALLTANGQVLQHERVLAMATQLNTQPAQVGILLPTVC